MYLSSMPMHLSSKNSVVDSTMDSKKSLQHAMPVATCLLRRGVRHCSCSLSIEKRAREASSERHLRNQPISVFASHQTLRGGCGLTSSERVGSEPFPVVFSSTRPFPSRMTTTEVVPSDCSHSKVRAHSVVKSQKCSSTVRLVLISVVLLESLALKKLLLRSTTILFGSSISCAGG